jgi:hypothetical protein
LVQTVFSAVSAGFEGRDRVRCRRGTDIGFQSLAAHDIHGGVKELRDIVFQSHIVEHANMRLGIDLDHDVNIAVGAVVAARP